MRYNKTIRKEVLIISQNYTSELKKKIICLRKGERTYKNITAEYGEYGVSKAAISAWCKQFREVFRTSPESKAEYDNMKELLNTSTAFVEFCESVHVTQSMSKAGYPYDNAPMERYFNTLKNEYTNASILY